MSEITIITPIGELKGIGPKKEAIFRENGLETVEDLLYFFPRSYQNRKEVTPIKNLKYGEEALVVGKVIKKNAPNFYKKNSPLSLLVEDETGILEVVFFNGKYLSKSIEVNEEYAFYGKVTENFARKQLIHPEFSKSGSKDDIRGVIPIYPKIQGISQKEIRRLEQELKPCYNQLQEWIPEETIKENRLADLEYTMENLHSPTEGKKVLAAKFRMVFSELLVMETGFLAMRKSEKGINDAIRFSCKKGDEFKENLGFALTSDQKDVWEKIKEDIEGPGRMNRLLQGDVGSGKTVVAEMAMISAADEGYQSVIMVPTEILAKQHLETFKKDFEPYGIEPKLLISSMDSSLKKETLKGIEEGSAKVIIATHAVIQEKVKFSNLALVITDEQHRFGVNQRRKLTSKGDGVNVLVMTATPIPRTLAVILYGDMATSQIRTMPEGRKPVKTTLLDSNSRDKAYGFALNEISKGRQVYVVAPLIEDSEAIDAASAERLYEELSEKFKSIKVALVHGGMSQQDKDRIMNDFVNKKVDMLVSTVVIEVGVNVPNATVMIIENMERFGLAQLHQLRGRVGRGEFESNCFLITDSKGDIARERGAIMCETNDGFEIAEKDLVLRGPGEIFGTRQHGVPQAIVTDLVKHIDVLEKAQKAALIILEKDPKLELPENLELKNRAKKMFGEDLTLSL